MASKRKKTAKKKVVSRVLSLQPFAALSERVRQLELDTKALEVQMSSLSTDVAELRSAVKQVDERGIRGEKLMLDMQGDQRRAEKALGRIEAMVKTLTGPKVPTT